MKNLTGQYIEISSEEEMEKASKWLESKGYNNDYDKIYYVKGTYLFIKSDNKFHFNNGDKQSYWKPFSILYDEGMPRDVLMGYRTAEITSSIGYIAKDEEDLLTKAKNLYPIGTKYKCAAGGYEVHTVESMDWYPSPPGHIYGEMSKGCIYKHGKWAEIVHEVKPVEKWSVGSYAVFLTANKHNYPKGTIDKIKKNTGDTAWFEKYGSYMPANPSYQCNEEFKWFPTLEEAEAFSKSLIPLTELQPPTQEWKLQIGDWVVTDNLRINDTGDEKYNGNIGQIWKIGSIDDDGWCKPVAGMHFVGGSLKLHNLRKVTQQEIDSMSKTADVKPPKSKFEDMSKDELLEYTKKKYPIGCKVKFPGYNERIISQELFWQYGSLISHSGCCPVLDITDGIYVWAEIIEMPKKDGYNPGYTYNEATETYKVDIPYQDLPKETHQLNNKTGKQFSPIKVELIKVKQLKIN